MVPNAAASASNPSSIVGSAPGDRLGADGRYELVERIGSGGMGAVWRAVDHKLGCERAVKVLDVRYSGTPAFVKRFRGEATAASRVAHPNVVAVLDVAEEDERPMFLVMELLEGKTLSDLVKGNGRLPWSQVQRYIDQIAAGLGAAHAQDVVHRDVKPGNCLVLHDGQVKILDFGIANVRDEVRLTAAGEIIGTCSYMAPEQIKGQVDKRSDIYALGVVAFRLLTGRVPFAHRDQDKVLLAHLTEPPPVPSSLVAGLPPGVDDFVLRMLAKQPHKRFDGMDELRRVLAGVERGAAVAIDGPTAIPPSKSPTAMFEDALTRARVGVPSEVGAPSEPVTPSGQSDPVRPRINTAPAGSGTLASLDLQAVRQPGTVLLGEGSLVASGGTQVTPGEPRPAGSPQGSHVGVPGVAVPPVGAPTIVVPPAGVASPAPVAVRTPDLVAEPLRAMGSAPAAPPRVVTVPTPVPRPLTGLAAGAASSPRVTRIATPSDRADGSMVGGVVAALGGIALAGAVVTGWVFYTRNAEAPAPTAAPAATIVADEGAVEAVEAVVPAAEGEPAVEPGATPPAEASAAGAGGAVEGVPEGTPPEERPATDASTTPTTPATDVPPADELATTDPRSTKKRRKPKAGETDQPDVAEPEPKPEPDAAKKKPGDLRDPW